MAATLDVPMTRDERMMFRELLHHVRVQNLKRGYNQTSSVKLWQVLDAAEGDNLTSRPDQLEAMNP